ncbi:MAG TPA: hypothetical protein VK518_23450 [Puia sp.]|nr:hypothetical protein [Puia sp.]
MIINPLLKRPLWTSGESVAKGFQGANSTALTAPTLIGMGRNPCVAGGVYTGDLDDVIAYNRVLSSIEVTSLYNYFSSTPLPLRWKSFSGQVEARQVYLKWETENSINNDRFEIERSANGYYLLKVNAGGNNTSLAFLKQ